jgi:hypothetical protein
MKTPDPNVDKVEKVAAALGSLTERVVFVGGCAAGLLCRVNSLVLVDEKGVNPGRG